MKGKMTVIKRCVLNWFKPVFIVLLWMPMVASAVEITTSVDRSQLSLNDSFQIIFQATESPDDEPDFSPLEQDFNVLNQSKSSQSSWINGTSTRSIRWKIDVMAKRAGELQIPAIHFGNDVSKPLPISVQSEAAKATGDIDEELFLDVQLSADQAYVQEQLLYTVRLYQRVNMTQASLTEPTVKSAVVERLGEDRQYNTQRKGVNYLVIERRYAIFPQQSGDMQIPPLTLNAQVVYGGTRSRFGGMFDSQRTRAKRVFSKALSVKVLPIPSEFKGNHWLVADDLSLDQSWSADQLNITVGEPITRTVIMKGEGVTASQLPDFTVDDIEGVKLYADQPVLVNQPSQEGVVGQREQKIAYIASKAGDFLLPAYEVPWFNRLTGKMEVTKIPSVTLRAVAKQGEIGRADPGVDESINDVDVGVDESQQATNSTSAYWKWLAIGFAVLWLVTLLFLFKKRAALPSVEVESQISPSQKTVMPAIEKATASNDAKALKKLLIDWCELEFGTRDINSLLPSFSADLQQEIKCINAHLYAKENGSWASGNIVNLLKEELDKKGKNSKEESALRPLHRV
jgi:hypothetical protein